MLIDVGHFELLVTLILIGAGVAAGFVIVDRRLRRLQRMTVAVGRLVIQETRRWGRV